MSQGLGDGFHIEMSLGFANKFKINKNDDIEEDHHLMFGFQILLILKKIYN